MERMDLFAVAKKWQKAWEETEAFKTEDPSKSKRKPFYCLEMFPYPSGYLHMGHVRNYSLGDVYARYKRMQGFNVLYPMGYDSFGLPAENAAIKNKKDPHEWTEHNIHGIKKQQQLCGFSYDWSREFATSHPDYYAWNQWIFLQMLKKGLAYRKKSNVNWCPRCETVLANEQVINGKCWRHEKTDVESKPLEQWYLKITEYADELLDSIPDLDWPERVKVMQQNWIGRSEGTLITFAVEGRDLTLETFTTRPDTAYGITYVVIAAEHPIIQELIKDQPAAKRKEVAEFIAKTKKRSAIERTAEGKPKTGVALGINATNPLTGEAIPLWVADYVLAEYGTGIVMAVPAHDQRDFEFAKKYKLPIKQVINPTYWGTCAKEWAGKQQIKGSEEEKLTVLQEKIKNSETAYVGSGELINSGKFDGEDSEKAKKLITKQLEKDGHGKATINYKLRDWLVSRQRYWGTPIPVVYCDKCGAVPIPEDQLPVVLPKGADFQAGGNPVATVKDFVNTKCPACGGAARRETDTLDTFFCSSWYFLRFCDPDNDKQPFDPTIANQFMPVNQYIGGIEHAILHLLYARFFTKFLRDEKLLSIDEPFARLMTLGMVTKDGTKMSKSVGNVVDPGTIIEKFGPDTARLFILFGSLPEKELEWSDTGVDASHRFLQRVASMLEVEYADEQRREDAYIISKQHSTIRDTTALIEDLRYSTAIQKIMGLANLLHKYAEKPVTKDVFDPAYETVIQLLAPIAPHLAEELWEKTGHKGFVSTSAWPTFNEKKIDEKAEAAQEQLEKVKDDIRTVLSLAKISTPKKITLYLPESWKYDLIKTVKKALEESSNPKDVITAVMKDAKLKQHGQAVMKMIPAFVKDRSKLPEKLFSPREEKELFAAMKQELSETFGCAVAIAGAGTDGKSAQGLPGKPAILVE